MYKRKVVKGRLCLGTRGSTLRLHWATRGLGETGWCSQRSLAISAGNCGSASEAQGGENRNGGEAGGRAGGTGGMQGGPLASLSPPGPRFLAANSLPPTGLRGVPGRSRLLEAGPFHILGVCLRVEGECARPADTRACVPELTAKGLFQEPVGSAPPRISGSLPVRLRSRVNGMSMFLKQGIY